MTKSPHMRRTTTLPPPTPSLLLPARPTSRVPSFTSYPRPAGPAASAMSVSKLSLNPFAKPSAGLAHLNRIMGSQSGQDKLFMAYCYSSHVVMYCLRSKQLATKGRIDIAERMAKLTAVISDARMLYVPPSLQLYEANAKVDLGTASLDCSPSLDGRRV